MIGYWLAYTKFVHLTVLYKVVQIWPGLIVCKQVTVCPGHIWTTLYKLNYTRVHNVGTYHLSYKFVFVT
jgi:hypothetical protein